ncbi:MAG: glycosyltransferase, partial [Tepidiformaceae bacterium]
MARRALILCTSCEIGGMERLAVGITRQLSRRGWDAELIFGAGPDEEGLLEWANGQGVRASAHPAVLSVLQQKRSWTSVRELARLIRSRKPDVVNLHYGGAHISLKDVLAVRLARAPRCVVQVHLPVAWRESGRRKRLVTRVA